MGSIGRAGTSASGGDDNDISLLVRGSGLVWFGRVVMHACNERVLAHVVTALVLGCIVHVVT